MYYNFKPHKLVLTLIVVITTLVGCGIQPTEAELSGPSAAPSQDNAITFGKLTKPIEINDHPILPGLNRVKGSEYKSVEFQGKTLTYQVMDGLVVLQGDLIVGTEESFERRLNEIKENSELSTQGLGITTGIGLLVDARTRPNNVVYYEIDSSIATTDQTYTDIEHALYWWQAHTPIQFIPSTTRNDRVIFQRPPASLPDCSTQFDTADTLNADWRGTGYSHKPQYVLLKPVCGIRTIMHEVGHILGLFHEHHRCDRASFITIQPQTSTTLSIPEYDDQIGNIYCNSTESVRNLGPYDTSSIMHYPDTSFSSSGSAVFQSLNPSSPVPTFSNWWVSNGDVDSINMRQPMAGTCDSITNSNCTYKGSWIFSGVLDQYDFITPSSTTPYTFWMRAEYEDMYLTIWRKETSGNWSLIDWTTVSQNTIGTRSSTLSANTQYAIGAERVDTSSVNSVTFDYWKQTP